MVACIKGGPPSVLNITILNGLPMVTKRISMPDSETLFDFKNRSILRYIFQRD